MCRPPMALLLSLLADDDDSLEKGLCVSLSSQSGEVDKNEMVPPPFLQAGYMTKFGVPTRQATWV